MQQTQSEPSTGTANESPSSLLDVRTLIAKLIMTLILTSQDILRKARRRTRFVEYKQEWSIVCQYCGCLHLSSASDAELRRCCLCGAIDEFPTYVYERLSPLPPYLFYVIVNDNTFSRNSSTYNNILSFAATGVANDSNGGFVNSSQGDNCVTINGRSYHFFPTASNIDPSGGLSYFILFILDLPEAVKRHAEICNRNYDGEISEH